MSSPTARPRDRRRRALGLVLTGSLAASAVTAILGVAPASAYSVYTAADGVAWTVNDARRPGLDTGSIRNIASSRAEAMGSLFVHVDSSPSPRMNDQMLRGFGLEPTGTGTYVSTQSVRLGDLLVTRKLDLASTAGTASFFDTFTNTSTTPLTVDASFGGSLGYGNPATAPTTAGTVSATSSGDAAIDSSDTWASATTQSVTNRDGSITAYRPTGVVVGDDVTHVGNQQLDPFTSDYSSTGSASNNPGFVHELTIAPGKTASLLQYVVTGTPGDQTAIAATAADLATTPAAGGLSVDEICTIANWTLATLQGFDPASCAGAEPLKLPTAPATPEVTSSVAYDVTGKTIAQLQADLSAGKVTSVQLTKAYLDRIQAYDGGQLGFHAFITVAKDAVAQAMAADKARAAGKRGDLLGIPIAIKDLYDTADMPTTGGTRALKDWQPGEDAWQVGKLREAGAVIIGKTNLSEFANSGSFSESGFKQTWNALYPSKTSFGSSGGSAVAVATSMAAAAMGTQTGVSLYAPSTGAGVSAFRGTDGLASTAGVMPLTWATDYAGPIAKDVTDLTYLLDATATQKTGNDPDDIITNRVDNSLRPTGWKAALNKGALKGKVIGYLPAAFQSQQIDDDGTGAEALADVKAAIEAAGGTLVPITGSPTNPPSSSYPITSGTSLGAEGWYRYMETQRPNAFPYATPGDLLTNKANLPYNVSSSYNDTRYDATSVTNLLARRDAYKANAAAWMDGAADGSPVDAVVYPAFLTGVGNNDASSAIMSSDRGSGVLTQSIGLPTAIIPIGTNDRSQSNNVQIMGRAWDDVDVLSYGYAIEQAKSEPALRTSFAPALSFAGPAGSTTSLSLASTAIAYGSTTSATVTVASDPVATGSVSVSVAGRKVTGALVGGKATVALPKGIPVGTYLVTASYAGSGSVAASTATATVAVKYAQPSVRAKLVKKKVHRKHKAKLKVSISAPVAGSHTVLIYDRKRIVTSVTVGGSGHRKVTLGRLARGKHRLKAYVAGDASYAPATSKAVVLKVIR